MASDFEFHDIVQICFEFKSSISETRIHVAAHRVFLVIAKFRSDQSRKINIDQIIRPSKPRDGGGKRLYQNFVNVGEGVRPHPPPPMTLPSLIDAVSLS